MLAKLFSGKKNLTDGDLMINEQVWRKYFTVIIFSLNPRFRNLRLRSLLYLSRRISFEQFELESTWHTYQWELL
jgi:hypothetical protein